jgi:hypothetical protein
MTTIDLITVRLSFDGANRLRPAPYWLRGAIAHRFHDNPLFHQHHDEQLLYRYPQIQYRWDDTGPMLVGLAEGARFLVNAPWPGMALRLGPHDVVIQDAICEFRRHELRVTPQLMRYHFAEPWLPFSQDNYRRYQKMNAADQAYERDRLARANILIGLRGFSVEVTERLYVAVENVRPTPCRYKDVEMLGFHGHLLANVDLPAGFALGRAISHGFGWILPMHNAMVPQVEARA